MGGVEIEATHAGQQAVAVAEEEGETVGLGTVGLDQIAVGKGGGEGPEHQVVGEEMGVADLDDGVDVERVAPDGILADVLLEGGHYNCGVEGHLLALLVVKEVAVGVFEGVDTVAAWGYTLDDKAPGGVGAGHARHRQRGEGAVGKVGIEAHEDALDGLEVLGIDHIASDLHGVDGLAGGEAVGVVAQRIVLGNVGDGIREVYGVGDIGLERVAELYHDALALALDVGLLHLGRRHDDLLLCVLYLDILVEVDVYLLAADIDRLVGGAGREYAGRGLVVPSAVGLAHAGTRRHDRQKHYGDNRGKGAAADRRKPLIYHCRLTCCYR